MLLTVFGVPTALTSFGIRAVRTLVQTTLGEHDLVLAGTKDELELAWPKIATKHIIYFNESPSGEIAALFEKSGTQILVFLDDPANVARALRHERSLALHDAIRTTTLCMSVLETVVLSKNAKFVNANWTQKTHLQTLIEAIADFFSIPISQSQLTAVMTQLVPCWRPGISTTFEDQWAKGLADKSRADVGRYETDIEASLIEKSLSYYRPVSDGKSIAAIAWSPRMFMNMDDNGRPADRLIDLTGRPRLLIYGPYLGLPKGRWTARVEFRVEENYAGCKMQIAAVSNGLLRQGQLLLPSSGQFELDLSFETVEPQWPVEIHFSLCTSAIEGNFELVRVNLMKDVHAQ